MNNRPLWLALLLVLLVPSAGWIYKTGVLAAQVDDNTEGLVENKNEHFALVQKIEKIAQRIPDEKYLELRFETIQKEIETTRVQQNTNYKNLLDAIEK